MKKKSTLVVPAAGKSSRYPNMKPKWLLTHPTGELMIDKVLNSVQYQIFDRTVITILREHCEHHEAEVVLRQIFGDTVEILVLEKPTVSAAQTVYETIKGANVSGQVVVKDSDCLVEYTYAPEQNYVVGLSVDSKVEIDRLQHKSFIIKNDDNVILDILEKEMISNIICLGVYSVKADTFVRAYEKICNSQVYKHESEVYVSHVISYLITCEHDIYEYVEADNFVDWGTVEEWYKEIGKHKTYIFDIDGVLLENCGKYGNKRWSNHFVPIESNMDILQELADGGNEIIFMTARAEGDLGNFVELLGKRGIKYKTIIHSCKHGKRIIINDFAPTNPFPSCTALSIRRNDNLGDYLK